MKILLDNNGRCIGYGDQYNWPYAAPSWINFDNFDRWKCDDLNNITNINYWTEFSPKVVDKLELVTQRIAKGLQVKLRYLAENAGVVITPQDNIAQLTAFQSVIMLLDVGDLQTALGAIASVPEASFVLTPEYSTKAERKQTYIDELTTAVADLFE